MPPSKPQPIPDVHRPTTHVPQVESAMASALGFRTHPRGGGRCLVRQLKNACPRVRRGTSSIKLETRRCSISRKSLVMPFRRAFVSSQGGVVQPGGSVKDRAALSMVQDLERRGRLGPGSVMLDSSSGNTGIALSMIAAARGYRLVLALPKNANAERRQLLAAYGAEIIDTSPLEGSDGAIREARRLAAENADWVYVDQYNNPANWRAHFETTGPEIMADAPGPSHFVATVGTGGTFSASDATSRVSTSPSRSSSFNPTRHSMDSRVSSTWNNHRPAHLGQRWPMFGSAYPPGVLRLGQTSRRSGHPDRSERWCRGVGCGRDRQDTGARRGRDHSPGLGLRYLSDRHLWENPS